MSQTLDTFLIGIGIDNQTTQGAREVQSSLDSIKRKALQSGLAVAGATGALSLMAGKTATNIRTFSQFSEQIGASTEVISAQSAAWERAGGSAEGYMGLMDRLAKMRAGVLKGDVSFITEAAKVGLNYDDMLNMNPDDLLPSIIGRMSKMNQQQRLNAVDMLGAESVLGNISVDGRGAFEAQTQKQMERFKITKQMEEESELLLTNWHDTMSEMSAITDRASMAIMPKMNEMIGATNEFLEGNRSSIHGGVSAVFSELADNIDLVVIGLAGLKAAGIGSIITKFSKLGSTSAGVGALAKNIGRVGMAYAASNYIANTGHDKLNEQDWYKEFTNSSQGVFSSLAEGGINNIYGMQPSAKPTVITPSQTAPLSAPVMSAQQSSYGGGMNSHQPNIGGYSPTIKATHNVQINLDGRHLQNFILETMSTEDEQTVKDLRSPLTR